MKKYRYLIIILFFLLTSCNQKEEAKRKIVINELDYSQMKEFPFELYSKEYMLINLSDFVVMYGKDIDKEIYPASLTKLVTLNVVLNNCQDYSETSYFTLLDYESLREENASVAGLKINRQYRIDDLLYALVLPSGADAAKALERYLSNKNLSMLEEMNGLGLKHSHFVNSTGLHDDNHYSSLDDFLTVYLNDLQYSLARNILHSMTCIIEQDELSLRSTMDKLTINAEKIGGKTGYTPEAGECISLLYNDKGRSYLLLLANADGNPYIEGEAYHFYDVNRIIDFLQEGE